MKTQYFIYIFILLGFTFTSCDEDEELPEFLDGTEFGILLSVDVTGSDILVADVNSASVTMDVSYDDTRRSVQSVVVQKVFVAADGTTSDVVEQTTVTTSPTSVSLSVSDLVSGISGLALGDIAAGDSFQINFITNYADGLVVDTYGTGVNPNFTVNFNAE